MKKTLVLTALVLASLNGLAKDIKTITLTTKPQMHCSGCEKKIKENVRFVKGVRQIQTNVERQTVTIEYDADKTNPEKISAGFKKIGYEVKEVKASAKPTPAPKDTTK